MRSTHHRFWVFVSILWPGFATWLAYENWTRVPLSPPDWTWRLANSECRDRFGVWPDGTPMGDDYLLRNHGIAVRIEADYLVMRDKTPAEITRGRWLRDILTKIDSCEEVLWEPIAQRERQQALRVQQVMLAVFALAPPIIFYPVGLVLIWLWGLSVSRFDEILPPHVGRGFL